MPFMTGQTGQEYQNATGRVPRPWLDVAPWEYDAYKRDHRDNGPGFGPEQADELERALAGMSPEQRAQFLQLAGLDEASLTSTLDTARGITPEQRARQEQATGLDRDLNDWRQQMWNFDPKDPWVQQQAGLAQTNAENAARLRGIEGPLSVNNSQQMMANSYVNSDMQRKQMAMGLAGMTSQRDMAGQQLDFAKQGFNRENQWREQDRRDAYNDRQYQQGQGLWGGIGGAVGGVAGAFFGAPAVGAALGSGLGGGAYGLINGGSKRPAGLGGY